MYPLLLPLLLLFSAQVLIPHVHATRPHYNMALDYSKVFCKGPLPQRSFGEVTEDWSLQKPHWSHLNFTSLADLCSAHGNPKGNMGGKCLRTGTMYFDTSRGLEILIKDARLRFECRRGCFCVDDENRYLAEDLQEAGRRMGLVDVPTWPRLEALMIPQGLPMPIPQLPPSRLFPPRPKFPQLPKMPRMPKLPQWPKRPRMPQVKPFIKRPLSGPSRGVT